MEVGSNDKKKSVMTWTDEKDFIMLTAMAGEGVFDAKVGSRERGGTWKSVAASLNCHSAQGFNVNQRSVRDRFNILAKRVKAKLSKEEREGGGGESDVSETERLVEELIVLSEESEKRNEDQSEAKREAMANEKKQALEMRDRALERLVETRKRNEEEKEEEKQTVTKKRRRSGGETLEWLRERAAVDKEMKERKMKEKREEREAQKNYLKEMEAMPQQQNEQVKLMQQQMLHLVQQQQQYQQQQQQQQQQQFALLQQQVIAMSQQQQQQSQALLAFLQRKN